MGVRSASAAGAVSELPFLRGSEADARLRTLCAARGAALPVLGALATALVGRKLHEELGYRSVGDWSREKLGLGARSVRDWARVWGRLQELPLLREAVCAGEVSFSVARLIVGLATPETEARCLADVRGRTVRAVEAMVRAVREAQGRQPSDPEVDADEDEARVQVRIRCSPETFGMWSAAVELARRVSGESLPVWACAEWMEAEAVSAVGASPGTAGVPEGSMRERRPLRSRRSGSPEEHGLRRRAWPGLRWRASRPALPEAFAALAEGLDDCEALEVGRRFRAAIVFLQARDLEIGRVLRQVRERRLHGELGFESFDRYVRERLDLAPRTARRLVGLAHAAHRAPGVATAFQGARRAALQAALRDALREGRITSLQAAAIARGAGALRGERGVRGELGERGQQGVRGELDERDQLDVRGVPPKPGELAELGDEALAERWIAHAERVSLRRLEDEVELEPRRAIVFSAPPEVAEAFLAMVRRVGLERLLAHVIRTWARLGEEFVDYADFERDGFRCTAPGCTARRGLESHHIWFRGAKGPDVPWNRTTLCAFHHRHAVHGPRAGRVRVRGRAPHALIYRLGGPGGELWRSGDVRVS